MEQYVPLVATGGAVVAGAAWLFLKSGSQNLGAVHVDKAAEDNAVASIESAIKAAVQGDPKEEIKGLGGSAPLFVAVRGKQPKQYKSGQKAGERPLFYAYFAIRGLGEVQRLMLAECGASYDHLMMLGGEKAGADADWRARSPNGLLPLISGLGIPHSQPLSQSGAIIRFLARRYGMMGSTEADSLMADVLYETAKDLGGHKKEIWAWVRSGEKLDDGAKGPQALAGRIVTMLAKMPDTTDPDAALTFGQMQLLHTLLSLEEPQAGTVAKLSKELDKWLKDCSGRSRIKAYLSSGLRVPPVFSDHGKDGGYQYLNGPVPRSSFRQ